jgi:tripartite-type tricarboxylate transporter receptor subunit TctC
MNHFRMNRRVRMGLCGWLFFAVHVSHAAEPASFPSQPLRIVVPAPAEGGISLQARMLAPVMREYLGQQVLVEHRAGAAGLIGAAAVARAPADGHTLLLASTALAVNAAWLPEQMPFDLLSDFAPVSLLSTAPLVLAVHPGVPAKSVPELVALVKRGRPAVRAGGNAAGSLSHVALSLFTRAAGLRIESVLFNGGGPAMQSLVHGQFDALFLSAPVALPLVNAQRLRALAVTATEPLRPLAATPLLQQFYPGLVVENAYALLAPAGTSPAVITRLHVEVRRALADTGVRERYAALGLVAVGSPPEILAQALRRDIERYTGMIRQGLLPLQ